MKTDKMSVTSGRTPRKARRSHGTCKPQVRDQHLLFVNGQRTGNKRSSSTLQVRPCRCDSAGAAADKDEEKKRARKRAVPCNTEGGSYSTYVSVSESARKKDNQRENGAKSGKREERER